MSILCRNLKFRHSLLKCFCTTTHEAQNFSEQFERVFSLPSIKYFALFNRLKVYQIFGTCLGVPTCGLLEVINVIPDYSSVSAAYIGITGVVTLSLSTVPFRNIIGHLYISEDNKKIKISSLDFWGKRVDRIVATEDWIPLLEIEPKTMDVIYISPQLTDGTKYKMLVKFGNILNAKKIGQVLE